MAETKIAHVTVTLGDEPDEIEVAYGTTGAAEDGDYAVLRVGNSLTIHVRASSADTLRRLAAGSEELAGWVEEQAGGASS